VVVCLEIPRAVLAERVDLRTRRMVEAGFVEEVRGLLDRGYGPGAPGMTGTGYREVARHLLGEASLAEAVEEVARRTRQYARRQATWFRHQLPDDTVRIDATAPFDTQVEKVLDAWSGATQVMEEDG
jgi:tRNA dimethylallyltransferase